MPHDNDLPGGFRPGDPVAGDKAVNDQTAVRFTVKVVSIGAMYRSV